MANIKVTSKQDAWNKVNQIFPTDYEEADLIAATDFMIAFSGERNRDMVLYFGVYSARLVERRFCVDERWKNSGSN